MGARITMLHVSAAERVWALNESRQLILTSLEGRARINALLLSKTTFPEAVKAVFRLFKAENLTRLQRATISFVGRLGMVSCRIADRWQTRYAEYVDAVRILLVVLPESLHDYIPWLKAVLCAFRNLRRILWTTRYRYSEGQIDLSPTGTRGEVRLAVSEVQKPLLVCTTRQGETRLIGLGARLATELSPEWIVTHFSRVADLPRSRGNVHAETLFEAWETAVLDDPDVIRIPWTIGVEAFTLTGIVHLPARVLPRRLQAPIKAPDTGDMMFDLDQLPRSITELEIERSDSRDYAQAQTPYGALGFCDFLSRADDFSLFEHLESFTVDLYHESLTRWSKQRFTSLEQFIEFLKTLTPSRPRERPYFSLGRGSLRSLRLQIVLPAPMAKILTHYRPDQHRAALRHLARLLSPCEVAVRQILRLGRPDCNFQLDVLAPFGETGKELVAIRALSDIVMAKFDAKRNALALKTGALQRSMEGMSSSEGQGRGSSALTDLAEQHEFLRTLSDIMAQYHAKCNALALKAGGLQMSIEEQHECQALHESELWEEWDEVASMIGPDNNIFIGLAE